MAIPWLIGAAVVGAVAYIVNSDDSSSSSSSSSGPSKERELDLEKERKETKAKEQLWESKAEYRADKLAEKYQIESHVMVKELTMVKDTSNINNSCLIREVLEHSQVQIQQSETVNQLEQQKTDYEKALSTLEALDEQFK